jgi:hypothetical protein
MGLNLRIHILPVRGMTIIHPIDLCDDKGNLIRRIGHCHVVAQIRKGLLFGTRKKVAILCWMQLDLESRKKGSEDAIIAMLQDRYDIIQTTPNMQSDFKNLPRWGFRKVDNDWWKWEKNA